MSKSEKRHFRLSSELQTGEKGYMYLYKCLQMNLPLEKVSDMFSEKYGAKSLEHTSKYLYQMLLKSLSQEQSHDLGQADVFRHITYASQLYDRDFLKEAIVELHKAKKIAKKYEYDVLMLLILRTELQYLSEKGFQEMSEKEIIIMQSKINKTTKAIQNSNMHFSLYTTLQKRLHSMGSIRTPEQKEMMNDLVLYELNLIARSNLNGFRSVRLHLLFQAYYYLSTGNYRSALRFFSELVKQFDESPELFQYPPIYYFHTLEGIVNTLLAMEVYSELPVFLSKLEDLAKGNYPGDFILKIRYCLFSARAKSALNREEYQEAKQLLGEYRDLLFRHQDMLSMEMQLNLHICIISIYIWNGEYQNANRELKKVTQEWKNFSILPQYRVVRQLGLIINSERREYYFLENDIRSIKRDIQKNSHLSNTEKILFRYILSCPLPDSKAARQGICAKLTKDISRIKSDTLEKQYQQTFNFIRWIEQKTEVV